MFWNIFLALEREELVTKSEIESFKQSQKQVEEDKKARISDHLSDIVQSNDALVSKVIAVTISIYSSSKSWQYFFNFSDFRGFWDEGGGVGCSWLNSGRLVSSWTSFWFLRWNKCLHYFHFLQVEENEFSFLKYSTWSWRERPQTEQLCSPVWHRWEIVAQWDITKCTNN